MEKDLGEEIKIENILDFLPMNEADIVQYFGKIRSGKTYIATADAVDLLNSGVVVYANWRINWQGYDERKKFLPALLGVLGLKRNFFVFPKENFHYLPIDANFFDTFSRLTDCVIFIDEGHIAFNSYEMTKMQLAKQAAILHTGHFDRAIRIISQRAMAIHVVMRANVNRFFKCEKIFDHFGIIVFRRTEYEEMTAQESVDLDIENSAKTYWGRREIFEMYNTKYLRGDTPASQKNETKIFRLKWRERLKILFNRK